MFLTCQKKGAWGHDAAKFRYTVAGPKIRVSKDLSTHAKKPKACRRRAKGHRATLLFPTTSAVVWATWAPLLSTLLATMSRCWCTRAAWGFKRPLLGILVRVTFLGTDNFWRWAPIKKLFFFFTTERDAQLSICRFKHHELQSIGRFWFQEIRDFINSKRTVER
jgi:hypothetical protein